MSWAGTASTNSVTSQSLGPMVTFTGNGAGTVSSAVGQMTVLVSSVTGAYGPMFLLGGGASTYPFVSGGLPEIWTPRQVLRAKREDRRRSEAEIRAEELLRSCLSERQDQDLTRLGWFDVPASPGRTYRVKRGTAGNVYLLGADGREVEQYCAHPSGVPAADTMLAQKLMLEAAESRFLKIANRTVLRRT